jgi:hypothetical protein
MTTKTVFRWEQDGAGGEHGTATFFPETPNEITVEMNSFNEANALYGNIADVMRQVRWDARSGILAEISRIRP